MDTAPILGNIKPAGMVGFLFSLPLILVLSTCMGIFLLLQSIYSLFMLKYKIDSIHELEVKRALHDFSHESLTASGGIELHALKMGPRIKSKSWMLFVHGFPECSYSWRHQMRHRGIQRPCN